LITSKAQTKIINVKFIDIHDLYTCTVTINTSIIGLLSHKKEGFFSPHTNGDGTLSKFVIKDCKISTCFVDKIIVIRAYVEWGITNRKERIK
jgi:hypothetical protein